MALASNLGTDWGTGTDLQAAAGPRVIHVAVVGGPPVLLAGVASALSGDPQLHVVAQGFDVEQFIAWAAHDSCDVFLLNTPAPSVDAVRLLQCIRMRQLQGRVLVLTTSDETTEMFLTLGLGVHGYGVLSALSLDDIRRAVLTVASHGRWACEVTTRCLMEAVADRTQSGSAPVPLRAAPQLSEREVEVLRLLSEGRNEAHIADQLFLTRSTVRTYLARIRKKLGVRSRTEAVGLAIRWGLLPDRRATSRDYFSLLRVGEDDAVAI